MILRRVLALAALATAFALPAQAQVYEQSTGRQIVVGVGSGGGSPPPASITPVVSAGLEASHVLKNAAGSLYSVYASALTGGVTGYLLIFNATSAPADGAVTPIIAVPFTATGVASANFQGIPPAAFSTGITAVISSGTTPFTKTTGTLTGFISGLVQ